MLRIKILALCVAVISSLALAEEVEYTPDRMPNVQVSDATQYVSDPENLLSDEAKAEVNKILADLRKRTTAEVVVVIPPSIGDAQAAEWCEELFTLWKLGVKGKDNGLLFMVSPGSRCTFIMTGYGVEGILPDAACSTIINRKVIPHMREDDLDGAVTDAVKTIDAALSDPAVAAELSAPKSNSGDGFWSELTNDWMFMAFVIGGWAVTVLLSIGIFFNDWKKARKCKTNSAKAKVWREHVGVLFLCAFLTLGATLIFYIIGLIIYRYYRTRPLKCPGCGAKMSRLSEKKDNEYLTASQDMEERLKTIDYDVWKCNGCGALEIIPYKSTQKTYEECPVCHTVALKLESDTVITPATTKKGGSGVKEYECKFCHHRKTKRYHIPRKEVAAAAAAGAVGSSYSSGGGGGWSGGGGWGGGSTGGGGAGGSW